MQLFLAETSGSWKCICLQAGVRIAETIKWWAKRSGQDKQAFLGITLLPFGCFLVVKFSHYLFHLNHLNVNPSY